jgi:hypothetical protein
MMIVHFCNTLLNVRLYIDLIYVEFYQSIFDISQTIYVHQHKDAMRFLNEANCKNARRPVIYLPPVLGLLH